jgi:hypothetical protein
LKKLVAAATVALILLLGVTMSIPVLLGSGAITSFIGGGQSTGVGDLARQDICGGTQTCMALEAYVAAARLCPGLDWSVLAGIGKVESDNGRSSQPGVHSGQNSAGAMGPMQFLASTWAAFGAGGNVYDIVAAAAGAARYLCSNGAGNPSTLRQAIWHYNHAWWYVDQVLGWAAKYAQISWSGVGGIVGALPKGPIPPPGKVIGYLPALIPLFAGVPVGGFPTAGYPWGQCTWFAAYQHRVPAWPGHGDGGRWYQNAVADGIAVSNAPSPGAVVSYRAGGTYSAWGHVAVVVAVPPNGTMVVAESNYVGLAVLDLRLDPLNDPDILGFIVGSG